MDFGYSRIRVRLPHSSSRHLNPVRTTSGLRTRIVLCALEYWGQKIVLRTKSAHETAAGPMPTVYARINTHSICTHVSCARVYSIVMVSARIVCARTHGTHRVPRACHTTVCPTYMMRTVYAPAHLYGICACIRVGHIIAAPKRLSPATFGPPAPAASSVPQTPGHKLRTAAW